MNEIIKQIKIEDLIYTIRGKQVMLDSDLARLYECKGGTIELEQGKYSKYLLYAFTEQGVACSLQCLKRVLLQR